MLPAAHRLTDAATFRVATRSGRRCSTRLLVVHRFDSGPATSPARVGLIVSKAVGGAVVRNRVRRRLRHLVAREHLVGLPEGCVVVVRALPAAAGATSSELDAAVTSCLRRWETAPAAGARDERS